MLIVATETFKDAQTLSLPAQCYGWREGTVEVTFNGRTQRVDCHAPQDGSSEWTIYHMAARYVTGSKVWPATVRFDAVKRTASVFTGFESRSGRHSRPQLCGFLADVNPSYISKR